VHTTTLKIAFLTLFYTQIKRILAIGTNLVSISTSNPLAEGVPIAEIVSIAARVKNPVSKQEAEQTLNLPAVIAKLKG
jgi:hypothetical protein